MNIQRKILIPEIVVLFLWLTVTHKNYSWTQEGQNLGLKFFGYFPLDFMRFLNLVLNILKLTVSFNPSGNEFKSVGLSSV